LLYDVDFEPIGRRGQCPSEGTLLEAARRLGVQLTNLCGGEGSCGRCKVQLIKGHLTPLTPVEKELLSHEELREGYRLACRAHPLSDVKLGVPPESLSTPQRTQVEGQDVAVVPDPLVATFEVQVSPPSLEDLDSDCRRLARALELQANALCQSIDLEVLRQLPEQLRSWEWRAQVALRHRECIALRPVGSPALGLAVDLGTTKVAGYLLDLHSGETLASKGLMNPQIAYGEDVVTRIQRCLQGADETARMQMMAAQAVQQLAEELTVEAGYHPDEIGDAVVVGNTAMHHLLLRLPVEQLVRAPYVPAVSQAMDVKARELGLHLALGAYVHLLPNIAGYVGADHVAMILSTRLWQTEDTVLALDIGTNTEICLADKGELTSVSCASGPAFEGAHIQHGMRAAAGAIERLRFVNDRVEYQTINGAAPVGLCGSGILDALAQLHVMGVVDQGGKMHDHKGIRVREGVREFVLVEQQGENGRSDITLTQHDVRQLQLAKGAIRTGISALLQSRGIGSNEIDEVIIAGAFGSYVDVASAITIGMLPALPLDRFQQVGNAAGAGARLALLSRRQREEAEGIAIRVRYIELASAPRFADLFSESMHLGEYRVQGKDEKE
jgi:uncharacterized 2Fe-2S/4Fe-4S cluster protein (DUF4445 family)